jgi:ADP-ribose pyrophosphatase YjhB (NUDIX family)
MIEWMLRTGVGIGHRVLLHIWRYLPLPVRKLAIRVLYPRFPVGAIAIVRDEAGRVLLVRQTYHRERALWGVPGGWLGRGETPREAAVRETFEETGVQVIPSRVLSVGSGPYGEISLAYECRIVGAANFRPSDETDQIGYFALSALPAMSIDTRRMLEQAIAAQTRWPDLSPSESTPVPAEASRHWPASPH